MSSSPVNGFSVELHVNSNFLNLLCFYFYYLLRRVVTFKPQGKDLISYKQLEQLAEYMYLRGFLK